MNQIQCNIQSQSSQEPEAESFSFHEKLELLSLSISEIQKYELVTTNQYLKQIKLIKEILEEISLYVSS